MYINCHTWFSMRFGTFSEVELLQMAQQKGLSCLALTDINNTSACLNFIRRSAEMGIRPIVGIDFRNGAQQQFVGLAKNNQGFKVLNSFLSDHSHLSKPFAEEAPELEDTFIIYPFEKVLQMEKMDFKDNEHIGISPENLRRLPFSKYSRMKDRLVIQQPVTFRNKRDFNAHRLLRAIDNNTLLSKLSKTEEAQLSEQMLPMEKLLEIYGEFPHLISNTEQLMAACSIHFDFGVSRISQNQKVFGDSVEEDCQALRRLCEEGLVKRYPQGGEKARQRLEKELETIRTMEFVTYFLINHDIVNYARSKGYFHVGRGSGANSIVAYVIGITNVDPIELDLYFERFINPYRASPPDFDIDFSWKDREDVTRYIFDTFDNVALLATYSTFKYKAVVRELGKVFGLAKEEMDHLSDGRYRYDDLDEMSRLVLKYGELIQNFPNHLSVHAAGILILNEPAHCFSATDMPPKGFPTVQFDMVIAEDVGIFKFDILSQRGLAKIKDALELVRKNRPDEPPVDISRVEEFKKDEKINALLSSGKAIGAYYVESPAMRGLLRKLQVKDYLGLVAASSVIRPGVAGAGMKNEYIRRHREPERRKDAHPILAEIMPETYGIMVYQEDVLKVAHQFAGLELGEADVLRRGMSGKFRSRDEFKAVEMKFISNCQARGYPDTLTHEVWEQIASFAGYAFAKGHSASYAVESYQSMYLKCYYPLEFMVAVLNNGGGFYSTEHYIHETRMCGGIVHPPCINWSEEASNLHGHDVYLGFGYLKSLETLVIHRILKERDINGPFLSLDDFLNRVTISLEQLTLLIRVGAFSFTGQQKAVLMWRGILRLNGQKRASAHPTLFKQQHKHYQLPKLQHSWLEDAYDEMELLGFPLHDYFELVDEELQCQSMAEAMPSNLNKEVLIYGILVNTRMYRTSQRKEMRFSTFTDLKGEYFDVVHFPQVVDKYPIRGRGVYACRGKVTEEFGHCSIDATNTRKLPLKPDPRSPEELTWKSNKMT